jgi:protein gp37
MSTFIKKTNISWANKTWNVIAGCKKVSPACKLCYAEVVSSREADKGVAKFKELTTIPINGNRPIWNGNINVAKEKLFNEPKRWKESSIIFVNSMSDLFYEAVSEELIFKIFDKMIAYNWHKYLVLTKREARMKEMIDKYCEARNLSILPDFIWIGVSVENNKRAALRLPYLAKTKASVKFVSAEPLLEDIDFSKYPLMDWYIAGGESVEVGYDPLDARPFDVNWARKIRDFCKDAGVAFHMKQIGCNPVNAVKTNFKGDKLEDIPEDLLIREYPN